VLPVIIFACVAIPLLIIAFLAVRRSRMTADNAAEGTAADRAEVEREFAAAEAYETEWREAEHRKPPHGPT
jgi:hypothetical protein